MLWFFWWYVDDYLYDIRYYCDNYGDVDSVSRTVGTRVPVDMYSSSFPWQILNILYTQIIILFQTQILIIFQILTKSYTNKYQFFNTKKKYVLKLSIAAILCQRISEAERIKLDFSSGSVKPNICSDKSCLCKLIWGNSKLVGQINAPCQIGR